MSGLVNNDNYEIKPSKIRLEASSICQLRCPTCPNSDNAMHPVVGNGFLKLREFQRLINENPWIKEVELSNYGEIFLNPELLEIFEYACERNVTLKADNGANLNKVSEGVLEGLVKYGLQSMTVSIDGASNETYKIYRVKGNFDTVIENIKKINLFKQKYQSASPQLTWQFVVFGHNEHQIQLAQKLASELGMSFNLKLNWDSKFSPVRDLEHVRKLVGAASREEYKQKYGADYGQGFCNQLWDEPQINWEGTVLGCCRNFWGDFGGNAFSNGLLKSINSEKIIYAREMLLGNRIAREDIPCTTCSIYLHMKSEGNWLRRTSLSVSDSPSVQKESNKTKHEETAAFYKTMGVSIGGIPKENVPKQAHINMSDADLMAFYSERYVDVDVAGFLHNERKERLYGLCNLVKPGEYYLDVGCANGAHMEILYQRGIQGIGMDLAVPNVLKGRETHPHLKFIHGFAETIPFRDNHFDIVLLGDVIEHFRNPKVTLSECLRVAKTGIVLCVHVKPEITEEHINPFSFEEILNLLKYYKLIIHFYDIAGGEISQTEAELKIQAFPWLLLRAEKTKQTDAVTKKVTATEGQAEHSRAVGEILSGDQWCNDTDHRRDETHLSRFKLLSHLVEGQKALEIGSGNGDLSVEMAKLGFDVVGIDVSEAGIHQSVELAKKESLDDKAQFMVMDATSLDFPDHSFDTVLIPEVLEHIRDSRRVLEQAVRVVRNGGRIIVSVPDGLSVPYPGHLRVFFKDTLTTELSQYAEEIQWHDLPFKKWLICSFFVRKKGLDITQGPPVDIMMPTYNGRKYIRNAVKSVLDQTYRNWNLIVVNDGGEDVKDILDEFQDNRIKYIIAEHKGKSHALNIGIKNSNGKYIGYLDDDDILYPLHLEVLVKAALGEKKDFVYADCYIASIDENDKIFERELLYRLDVSPWMLMRQNYINHKNILHKRSLFDKTGLYDEELNMLIDWDMIRRLSFIRQPYHIWSVISEHFHYYKKGIIGNRLSGLWNRDPDKVRRSMEAITNKTMRLTTTAKDLKKALVDALLHRSYYHQLEINSMQQEKDMQISDLNAALQARDMQISDLNTALQARDSQLADQDARLIAAKSENAWLNIEIRNRDALISQILSGVIMTCMTRFKLFMDRIFPPGTGRNRSYQLILRGAQIIVNDGWASFWQRYRNYQKIEKTKKIMAREVSKGKSHWRTGSTPYRFLLNLAGFSAAYRKYGGVGGMVYKFIRLVRQVGIKQMGRRLLSFSFLNSKITTAEGKTLDWLMASRPEDTFEIAASDYRPLNNKKIALVIHAFYTDVFAEICSYLKNIPVDYTPLISVKDEKDRAIVEREVKNLPHVDRAEIRVVQNTGRDIAPIFVDYGPLLKGYDYICHVHTKKSPYTGQPEEWRKYLYENLLGSKQIVHAILSLFEKDPSLGLIYPEEFYDLPYWGHTWLGNKSVAAGLMQRMGIGFNPDDYIDFPASSMLWARWEALEPLIDLKLSHSDFPAELGQTDGTLQHTIERSFGVVAQSRGFKYAVIKDRIGPLFSYRSSRNLHQYFALPLRDKIHVNLPVASVVTFDVFDTLLSRPFAGPDMVFMYLEEQVAGKYGIKGYFKLRKDAEQATRARKQFTGDVKISEIYRVFAELEGLPSAVTDELLNLEVTTEINLLLPRQEVIQCARQVKSSGKRILIVSDTYLEKRHLEQIIQVNDIDFFDGLYLSCETGRRKDRGDMWDYVLEQEAVTKDKLLHIGDNEQSDIHILYERGFLAPVHVMRPSALFKQSPTGELLFSVIQPENGWRENLLYGMIANRLCMDPDATAAFQSSEALADPSVFGYVVFGPIVFDFLSWLVKKANSDGIKELKFIAREGFLLNQVYQQIVTDPRIGSSGVNLPRSSYFICSRRAAVFASLRKAADIPSLLDRHFDGTLQAFFEKRLNVVDLEGIRRIIGVTALNRVVSLPHDYDLIYGKISQVFNVLLRQAEEEREAFTAYCKEQGLTRNNVGLVDVGYSGTIQKALINMLGRGIAGYYMVTDSAAGGIPASGSLCRSCFGEFIDTQNSDLALIRYRLLLEAVLTAPAGQLSHFALDDDKAVPRFKKPGISQRVFPTIQGMHGGIMQFVGDMLRYFGPAALDIEFPHDVIMKNYELIITGAIGIGNLSEVLSVENDYCGNPEIPVLDFYQRYLI